MSPLPIICFFSAELPSQRPSKRATLALLFVSEEEEEDPGKRWEREKIQEKPFKRSLRRNKLPKASTGAIEFLLSFDTLRAPSKAGPNGRSRLERAEKLVGRIRAE